MVVSEQQVAHKRVRLMTLPSPGGDPVSWFSLAMRSQAFATLSERKSFPAASRPPPTSLCKNIYPALFAKKPFSHRQ